MKFSPNTFPISTNFPIKTVHISPIGIGFRVEVSFIKADGTKVKTSGKCGDSLLDVVVNNSIDLEGFGACEGTLTCSTCHLIFKPEDFERLPGKYRNNTQ